MKQLTAKEIEYLAKEYIDNNFDIRTYTLRDIRESYKDGYKDCQDAWQPRPISELEYTYAGGPVIIYDKLGIPLYYIRHHEKYKTLEKHYTHYFIPPTLKTN